MKFHSGTHSGTHVSEVETSYFSIIRRRSSRDFIWWKM